MVKTCSKRSSVSSALDEKILVSLTTVWGASSRLIQTTLEPAGMVNCAGVKEKLSIEISRVCGAATSICPAKAGWRVMGVDPRGSDPGTRWQAPLQAPTPAVVAVNRIIRCILKHMAHLAFRRLTDIRNWLASISDRCCRRSRPVLGQSYSGNRVVGFAGNKSGGFGVWFPKAC